MKKILLITSIILTLSIIVISTFNNMDNKENNIISNIDKNKQVINSNMITMMYETESGSGEYTETKDTTWPESGYIFNDTLSGCENGGELEYNSQNNTVNLLSNRSDRCYVYFDKYDGVWIDNVSVTNVTGSSVTLDVSATSENGSITTYYYALNDSEEYQESAGNIITINNLNKLTEYKISIYAIDSTNAKSNIYELIITTTVESRPIINSVEVSNITTNSFTLIVNVTSDVPIEKYYFTIEDEGENNAGASTTNSYTFTNLNSGTNYNISVFVENANNMFSEKYSLNVQTEEPKILLADYIKGLYTSQGANGIYYHTSSLDNSANDNSYRYSGANPDNYVCFGSTAATCPLDNLYRIIGVFGSQVKLIKADYTTTAMTGSSGDYYGAYDYDTTDYKGNMTINSIASYYWNNSNGNSSNNTWNISRLNTINLNNSYINYIGSMWSNKIATTNWHVGGTTFTNVYSSPVHITYGYEIGSITYSAKIGLMYVSDYGYATSPSKWATNLGSYDNSTVRDSNWLYLGLNEWTISRSSDTSLLSFHVYSSGSVDYATVSFNKNAIRPCFYLNSDVLFASGDGSQSNPFRIQI